MINVSARVSAGAQGKRSQTSAGAATGICALQRQSARTAKSSGARSEPVAEPLPEALGDLSRLGSPTHWSDP